MDTMSPSTRWGWLVHGVLLTWIGVVLAHGALSYRSEAELWEAWRGADPELQIQALNALSQRASSEDLALEFPAGLLNSDSVRLRELAFTNLFTRRPATRVGLGALRYSRTEEEKARSTFWLQEQMTTPNRVSLEDLDLWFESMGD